MNTEWSLREVMKSPIAAILFTVMMSGYAVAGRAIVVLQADKKDYEKQLILCKEESAQVIERLKNDQIAMFYRFQARQDSFDRGLDKTVRQVDKMKRRIK